MSTSATAFSRSSRTFGACDRAAGGGHDVAGGGGDLGIDGLVQDGRDAGAQGGLGIGGLVDLVTQIPDESVSALFDDGVDEIALALEVAVEGVVGESRGGHDVGDARGFAPGEQFASAPDQGVDVAARGLLSGRQASLHGLGGAGRQGRPS
nr:hypothetical protein [Rhodococcus pyridinivorans]